jgi:hypothetical protein
MNYELGKKYQVVEARCRASKGKRAKIQVVSLLGHSRQPKCLYS